MPRRPKQQTGDGRYIGKASVAGADEPQSPVETARQMISTPSKWEHCQLKSEDGAQYYGMGGIPATFNELGSDGWELVTVYPVADAHHAPVYYAVFKRELQKPNG